MVEAAVAVATLVLVVLLVLVAVVLVVIIVRLNQLLVKELLDQNIPAVAAVEVDPTTLVLLVVLLVLSSLDILHN
jgi:uncharacterized membrane protein